MKWTVVGYWGGHPEVNEATSSYLLEDQGFKLLIDCGSGVLAQLPKYTPIADLDALILSHYHHDHIADVGPLQYAKHVEKYIKGESRVLPIYGHQLEPDKFAALDYEDATKAYPYEIGKSLSVGPYNIDFLQTVHPAPCAAMRITNGSVTMVYTADTSYIPELVSFSSGADLLIAECSLYKGQDGSSFGHMNSLDVGRLAREAEVPEVLLTHLPHYGNHHDLLTEAGSVYNGKLSLAASGWHWEK
ncbi:MBL fold metallo-hydrolase [Camelliibacillus cellulosilyticus]|uniref:MBL fold metallo-hydrolase n=1 Tax=Camelliibacillus cellulosilyticus TaxID=2174486 RepID=A0ABV9GLT1_9BACL